MWTQCVLFCVLLLNFAFDANGAAPQALTTYKIDLGFLADNSVIRLGTPEETDSYNRDVSDNGKHPVFAEEALLDFGTKKVRAYLIASTHSGDADIKYIEDQIARLSIDTKTTRLFVEQGDPAATGGSAALLEELIHNRATNLEPALERARTNPVSFLNPDFFAKLTFAKVARSWAASGGSVIDFDLATNFHEQAIQFMIANVKADAALRIMREKINNDTFTFSEFQTLLREIYPHQFDLQMVDSSHDCCATSREWVKSFLMDNQIRNLVRERYMKLTLATQLKDGDVILTHPVHMNHILASEQTIR